MSSITSIFQIIKLLYSALVRYIIEFDCVIWSLPFGIQNQKSFGSNQKQIILLLNNDHLEGEDNYVLAPYMERDGIRTLRISEFIRFAIFPI